MLKLRHLLSLILVVLLSLFLMADMFITPAIIPELAQEYNVSASLIGWAGTAFMLFGAFIGLFFGYINDSYSRKKLLLLTVLLGEIPCLLTGIYFFTDSFTGFVIMRTLTGIGVGGVYPITFSLLSDYVSEKHRAKACALVDIAWGVGMMSGPLLASYALNTDYGWRLAFVLAALPSFPLAILYAFIAKEPKRGASELTLQGVSDTSANSKIRWSDYKIIANNKSNILLFLQGIPGSLPWGLLPFWLITYFREAKSFTSSDATWLWEIFGIATAIGGLLWGIAGDKLFNLRPRYNAIMCTIMIGLGTLPLFALLNQQWPTTSSYFALAILGGLFISVGSSNIRALLMNVNIPEHRGAVFSIYNFTDNIGRGLGPAIGGVILATTSDYSFMVNFAVCFWLISSLIFSAIIFTIDKDRENTLLTIKNRF